MSNKYRENSKDSEIWLIGNVLSRLEEEYSISEAKVLRYLNEKKRRELKQEIRIPISVFRCSLSPLKACIKYLHENRAFRFCDIAKILNRNDRTIWNSYNSTKKEPIQLNVDSNYFVVASRLQDRKYSFLESICCYLREHYNLSYHKIAVLLGKDDRTIWTVCKRAENKKDGK